MVLIFSEPMDIAFTNELVTGLDEHTPDPESVKVTVLPFPYTVVRTVAYLLLAVFIAFCNTATIAVIVRSRSLGTVTNNFIISLSAADLLMTPALVSYCYLIYVKDADIWRLGLFFDLLPGTLSSGASLFTLLLIAIDRYIAVAHPFSYKHVMTVKTSRLLIVFVWGYLTALITCIVTYFGYFGADDDVFEDHLKLTTAIPATVYKACIQTHICVALLVTILLYALTYRALRRQMRRLTDVTSATSMTSHKTKRVTEMMVIVVVALILCWTPFTLFNSLVNTNAKNLEAHLYYLDDLCYIIVYINSFINPVVYAWKSAEFRQGYAQLWMACRPTLASQTDNRTQVEVL